MKKTLMVAVMGTMLMATAAFAEVRFGIGVNIGAPVYAAPAPVIVNRPYVAVRPPMPRPGSVWIDGFYGPRGWVAGYWAAPPFAGAYWVAPRFEGRRFFEGYWGGNRFSNRERFEHERFEHERFENRERFEHGFRR